MKKNNHEIFKILALIFLFNVSISCSEKEQVDNSLDLSTMELELDIDLSKGKFDLSQDIDVLSKEMTDLIFSVDSEVQSFSIRKSNNILLINYPQSSPLLRGAAFLAPCKTQKKTCRSKKCVKDTLKKILGDGDRDVDIKYRRNTFSVTIEYTYQDC